MSDLRDRYIAFRNDPTLPYTAVVVPSQSVDPVELRKIEGVAHYEERSLFNLMLLRHPRLKVVFVTSKRLDPLVVDYYLHQIRGVPSAHARRRLVLLDCDDASARPLTQKVLERPYLVERIHAAIDDPDMAHMAVFNSTSLERDLAARLGIPLNASNPGLTHLGSKTGSRRVFGAAGVEMAPGHEGLRDVEDVVQAVEQLHTAHPELSRLVVKLDDSFSGEGNAVLDLGPVRSGQPILDALRDMRFEAAGLTWEPYAEQLSSMGGIVEGWMDGADSSPSAQLRIDPLGEVVPVSTHDQVLGGPSGQIFVGATFPASPRWRAEVQRRGEAVGRVLSEHGVIGRFAVDFVASGDRLWALEINLRQGGTTHPFNTLKFLTDGRYDADSGTFHTRSGEERCYFATDVLQSPAYRGLLPFDLLDALAVEGMHFGADETGVVFHLLGCLSQYGKLGCTAIGATVDDALAKHAEAVALLDRMGQRT